MHASPHPGQGHGPGHGPDRPGPHGPPQAGPYGRLNPYGGDRHRVAPAGPGTPPGQGGPPGRRSTGRPAALLAAGLAALLAIGGGTWFALSGDDKDSGGNRPIAGASSGGPSGSTDDGEQGKAGLPGASAPDAAKAARLNAERKPGDAQVLWLRKNDVDLPSLGGDVFGPWLVGDTIVTAMYRSVTAHSVADGTLKWSLPLGTGICRAPQHASDDDKIVLAVQERPGAKADECRQLRMIDLRTGKQGWQQKIKEDGLFDFFYDYSTTITGNTVTAGRYGHSTAYRLSDGKPLWGKWDGGEDVCRPYAYASEAPVLVAAVNCPTDDADNPQEEVHGIDPATGASRWKYRLPRGYVVEHVYSVRPLVVYAVDRAKDRRGVLVLNDDGTKRSSLRGQDQYANGCSEDVADQGNLQTCQVVADDDTLYMATGAPDGREGANSIVAFDLDTGAEVRRIKAPGVHTVMPLRMEGNRLLVRIMPTITTDEPGALASVGPGATELHVLLQLPASTVKTERMFIGYRGVYADGRYFLVDDAVVAENDAEEKERETMMAIGE
ncbi:PQQ-binding-like beta-propeller repeat protein [Streptomyces sp. NPDC059909]|uniref:outer membrane protein assembly factor BamB family protein n=1 Tax=Streptomyces sp. NPDC059909 TaxID=3346998 RepID=UPI003669211A